MVKKQAFDHYAKEYDRWFDDHAVEYELELEAIRKFIPGEAKGIEIGAGTGRFMQPLGVSLGIEPSGAMREIAISRGVEVVDGLAESLPVEDASYDYALMVTTVCFLESTYKAFEEVHRILKPQGFIIIGMVDADSMLGRKYQEKKNSSRFYKEATFHSVQEVENDLIQTGFFNIEYMQAILPGEVKEGQKSEVKAGYGEGSFVALRAQRRVA